MKTWILERWRETSTQQGLTSMALMVVLAGIYFGFDVPGALNRLADVVTQAAIIGSVVVNLRRIVLPDAPAVAPDVLEELRAAAQALKEAGRQ